MFKILFRKIINFLGYDITRTNHKATKKKKKEGDTFSILLDFYLSRAASEPFYFVQVGANDGKTNDPLYPFIKQYNLPGLLVEPVPEVFKELENNYRSNDNIKLANVALADECGLKQIYIIRKSFQQEYCDYTGYNATGLASFDKEHLGKHLLKNMGAYFNNRNVYDYLEEVTVEAIDFNSLAERYNLNRVDILQIDCEGYDYEVLKMFDFQKYSPTIINYEHKHLNDEERVAGEKLLLRKGYKWFYHKDDTCAYKVRFNSGRE